MKIKLDADAIAPTRAHDTDAGLDLYSPVNVTMFGYGSTVIDTGIHIQLPHGTAGLIVAKSGMNIKHKITSTGLIDEGYTGAIKVRLYNDSCLDYKIRKGDKISQLVVIPVLYEPVEIVDSIEGGERGDNGFGSTGR